MTETGRSDILSVPVAYSKGMGAESQEDVPKVIRPAVIKAMRRSKGSYRCDWCGQESPEIRRSGSRICRQCWDNMGPSRPLKC
jgi:ribosomal protein S14